MSKRTENWMAIAFGMLGIREIPGPEDNPEIVEMHQHTSLKAKDDSTPWCSAFLNAVMDEAGIGGTNSAAARSWLKWGVPLDAPQYGCVGIMKRGGEAWMAHVFIYLGPDPDDPKRFLALGGNQNDAVRISSYPLADVLGWRWAA